MPRIHQKIKRKKNQQYYFLAEEKRMNFLPQA
jgi:hypothetical protein